MKWTIGGKGLAAAVLLAVGVAGPAAAQETDGRTDGAEGSEVGKGGYSSANNGRFSLALNWGASVQPGKAGTPLFVGLSASYWAVSFFSVEATGAYLANNGRVNALIGPKLRTGFYPLSLYAGLKAGAIIIPTIGLRFGLSPEVGVDFLLIRKLILGLGYAPDFAIGGDGVNHRVFMNIGYRF